MSGNIVRRRMRERCVKMFNERKERRRGERVCGREEGKRDTHTQRERERESEKERETGSEYATSNATKWRFGEYQIPR